MKKILSPKEKSAGNLWLHSFDLADQDREALSYIRKCLGLTSNDLAVRIAIRELATQLKEQGVEKKK